MATGTTREETPDRASAAVGSLTDPAITDAETGLPNRLHFEVVYRVIFTAGTRGLPITLLLMQVDGAGGQEPDLGEFAERLVAVTRRMDLLARFDEGRFALLLMGCNVHGGRIAAERLLGMVSDWLEEKSARLAMGVAALQAEMNDKEDLIRMAEAALVAARSAPSNAIEARP